jgi:hypothetical protein
VGCARFVFRCRHSRTVGWARWWRVLCVPGQAANLPAPFLRLYDI